MLEAPDSLADRVLVTAPPPGPIAEFVAIALPQPRSREAMSAAGFGETIRRIREHLEASGAGAHRRSEVRRG